MDQVLRASEREHRFRTLYDLVRPDLVRFVQRRAHPDHAEDVVAEAMLVVWRRLEEVPTDPGDARAWVFGVTRNILLNAQRGAERRRTLGVRLADVPAPHAGDLEADLVARQVDVVRAWQQLSQRHQEALGLAVFEELTAPQAAAVLGISPVAFRLRLSRARRALALLLKHLPQPASTASAAERTSS